MGIKVEKYARYKEVVLGTKQNSVQYGFVRMNKSGVLKFSIRRSGNG